MTTIGSFAVGDVCPKCGTQLVKQQGAFAWRGRLFPGMVCIPCNALYDCSEDSFWNHVTGKAEEAPAASE